MINEKNSNKEDVQAIILKSRIFIDAKNGDINSFIKEKEENIKENTNFVEKNRNLLKNQEIYPLNKEELLYDNGFGGFKNGGKEYFIYKNIENKLPSVWCNILANNSFGTVVTDNLGGYVWDRNCRLNRLTSWNNDQVRDLPSEIYYLKDEENGEYWTINSSAKPNENYYYITNGFGYTIFQNCNNNLIQNVDIFVPIDDNAKILNFKLKNTINEKRNLKLLIYVKPVLGEDEIVTNGDICVNKICDNIIKVRNIFADENFKPKEMYILSTENISSFTGNKQNFFGNGNIIEPDSLYRSLDNCSGICNNSCVGIEINFSIDKFENKDFTIVIGSCISEENMYNNLKMYKSQDIINQKLYDVKSKWNNILNIVNVKTPSDSINILMNGWLVYQTISSRILAKTGYYQSGGAFGFRDQLQDCLGIKYIDCSFLREQILNCCMHQFYEGDVLHWWHQETRKGIRTRFSDDLLWLVYGTIEYVEFTNNYDFLDEEVEYIKGEFLKDDELEKYEHFHEDDIKESVFEHCIKSIENVISKGIDPFPKIGVGDWNDGFSNIGSKGKGQSIWLGFFLYDILNRFIPICEAKNRDDLIKKYSKIKENLKYNLNTKGWDGRWYKRAINDDGLEIGSINSEECRIDGISQSWAVISNAGDNDKKYISMSEFENNLVDKENKLIKLFDPPFEKSNIDPGYIMAYPEGIRENRADNILTVYAGTLLQNVY